MGRRTWWWCWPLFAACSEEAIPGTQLGFAFDQDGFYAAPFPSEHRRREDGTVAVFDFPNPARNDFVEGLRRIVAKDADGFGRTSAIYFSADGPLGTRRFEIGADVGLRLVQLDAPMDPPVPVTIETSDDSGPHGAPHLLSILPLQGRPLASDGLHALVVERRFNDASGAPLGVPLSLRQLLNGEAPAGLTGEAAELYLRAVEILSEGGQDLDEVAGLAVFRTGHPERGLFEAFTGARLVSGLGRGQTLAEVESFPGYCVFHGTLQIPVFQSGDPPYAKEGGGWQIEGGRPVQQRLEEARVVVTTPRGGGPRPTVVFVRTGGGGDRPLVDRGRRATPGGPPITPGSGPAQDLAAVGWAGISVDGPLGGLRNPTGADEQFLIFNFANLLAMRDNLRQSALELAMLADWIPLVSVTSTTCGTTTLGEPLVLMGHSMGATIGPLALAIQPRFQAGILSGAGASWIENVIHKQSPLPVRPIAEILIGYSEQGRSLGPHDPVLNLLEWAGEPADPSVYATPRWGHTFLVDPPPQHLLMFQGVVDTYILPPIANTLSLSYGLDLAEPALEPSLPALLPRMGRGMVQLPISNNRGTTRVVVQHAEDGIEDGHEVMFQTEGPKHQYRCFLASLANSGAPHIVPSAPIATPCP
ncbi:MAG: hypothetical protein IPG45_17195 [Deltaproteobacteria bacterium]|nr:hypothetical protein [Deltaproteobacteria bacterium]